MSYNDFQDDDIAYEIEGIRKFEHRPIPEFYKTDPRKTRTFFKEQAVEGGVGYAFIRACPEDTVKRYETLCHFESLTKSTHDHSFLIGIACQIIESELCRLLAEPSRTIGRIMLRHLDRKKKKKPFEIIEKWLDRRTPTMMGVISCILMSLRYAIEDKNQDVLAFINQYFRNRYLSLLLADNFIASYDKIKNDFRNPANHGVKIFNPKEYQEFVLLSVGAASIREWGRNGVGNDQSVQEKAVFHHHLAQSKLISIANPDLLPKPRNVRSEILMIFQKINQIASPHTACRIEVRLSDTLGTIRRDMTFKNISANKSFRLGSEINIGYCYNGLHGDVEMTLFDVGTSGKLTVLMPDDRLSEDQIAWFLDIRSNQAITLTGMTGIETIVALATKKESDLRAKLGLNKQEIVQEFSGKASEEFMNKLIEVIGNLPKELWAIGEFEFEITD